MIVIDEIMGIYRISAIYMPVSMAKCRIGFSRL